MPYIRVGYLRSRRYPALPLEDIEQLACLALLLVGQGNWKEFRRTFDNLYERTLRDIGYRKIRERGVRKWVVERYWYERGLRPGAPYGNKNRVKGKSEKGG